MIASIRDVKDRWLLGAMPVEDRQIEVLLEDAEQEIATEYPHIYKAAASPDAVEHGRVIKVACQLVIRVLRNPHGYRSISDGTGPFSDLRTYGGDNPGEMALTKADRNTLQGTRNIETAFTITPRYGR